MKGVPLTLSFDAIVPGAGGFGTSSFMAISSPACVAVLRYRAVSSSIFCPSILPESEAFWATETTAEGEGYAYFCIQPSTSFFFVFFAEARSESDALSPNGYMTPMASVWAIAFAFWSLVTFIFCVSQAPCLSMSVLIPSSYS